MNNDNNISNGISLKNIISRNKHYNKSKQKESQKDNNNKGRNCLRNLEQENNNFYTTRVIHALPEASVRIGHQLPFSRKSFQGFLL